MKTKKFTWFQKLIFGYLIVLSYLMGLSQNHSVGYPIIETNWAGLIGYMLGMALVIYLFMWIYNKFISPRINIKNKIFKKSWIVIKIIVTCLIGIWFILFAYGLWIR